MATSTIEEFVMEVSRRPDSARTNNRWESSAGTTSSSTSINLVMKPSDLTPPDGGDLRLTNATGCGPSLVQRHRVTMGDVIDGLLEVFQREWMTLRPNGRMQSKTIWRNGNDHENICIFLTFQCHVHFMVMKERKQKGVFRCHRHQTASSN